MARKRKSKAYRFQRRVRRERVRIGGVDVYFYKDGERKWHIGCDQPERIDLTHAPRDAKL